MLKKHITFLLSLLVFAFPAANAMPVADVYRFCQETSDVDFCSKRIGTDKRIVAARDLNDVLLIAIAQSKVEVTNAANEINRNRQKFSGPIGKERISFCERNYRLAFGMFTEAEEMGKQKVLAYKAHTMALGATNYMRECEDEWKKNGPVQKSPVTLYNTNAAKLFSIIRKIIDKLYPS